MLLLLEGHQLRNGGQSCIGTNRIYVQAGIADDFVDALSERVGTAAVGHGLGDGTVIGPLIDDRAVRQMQDFLDDAAAHGATVRTGGCAYEAAGSFFAPTVIDNVPPSAAVVANEIFGPIAAVQRFTTEDEVVARSNETEYDLAGYVFTESIDRALNVADRMHTGLVGINQGLPSDAAAPFGGLKQSGLGREGSGDGLEEYQDIRFYNVARRATS